MDAKLTIDTRRFTAMAKAVILETKADAGKTFKRMAGNVVENAMKLTPPFNPPGRWQDSLNSQRSIGNRAVRSDINAAFRPMGALRKWLEDHKQMGTEENKGLRKHISKLIYEKRWFELNNILLKLKRSPRIIQSATPELHQKTRGRWGRVRLHAKKDPYFVRDLDTRRALIDYRLSKVGMAKAGWVTAALRLGKNPPMWIRRHNQPGLIRFAVGGEWPAITVGNLVPWIQEKGQELLILKRAIDNQSRNLRKELEVVVRKNWAKRGKR